jgi:hypothetical protein
MKSIQKRVVPIDSRELHKLTNKHQVWSQREAFLYDTQVADEAERNTRLSRLGGMCWQRTLIVNDAKYCRRATETLY